MLEIALQYAARGWPVFPVSASKTPFKGSHGLLDATTDPQRIQELWKGRPTANVALATGALIVIDPDGPTAVARLVEIGAPHGGWPQTLTAKTPRSIHLFYRPPVGVEIRSYNEPRATKGADGIDIKGLGGYVILSPSRIKKGSQWFEYKWLLDLPIAELPDFAIKWIHSLKGVKSQSDNTLFGSTALPAYLAKSANNNQANQSSITKRASASLGEVWSERSEQRIRSALAAIPAKGYDQWLSIGMALHSLDWGRPDGTDIGFDLFDEWSATEPELYSLDAVEKKWISFGRNARVGVSLGTLFHLAEQHGWEGLTPQPETKEKPLPNGQGQNNSFFQPAITAASGHVTPSSLGQINGHNLEDEEDEVKDTRTLHELNYKYACIGDVGGKCMVMGWVPSKSDPAVEIPSFQSFKSFGERYANKYVIAGKEKKDGTIEAEPRQMGAYWLKWRRRRSYDAIDLIPGGAHLVNGNTLNLWRGFAVPAAAGGWPLMQTHIAEVLAGGEPEALDYIMRWSAWAVQHPGERAEAALVFRGGKGSGKGTFAHVMRRLFGAHGLHISNPKHLVGAFNAHLRNCLLLYADEAFWAGDKQGESTLKALITESTLTIEQKGVDAVQWRNRIHLIMTANAEWVVPASHDERRYAVFNVAEHHMNDKPYFDALHDELNGGGLAAMLHDLQNVKLGDWHPRYIVKTRALTEQKMQSMTPIQEWWESMLQDGFVPAAPKDSPDCAMAVYLLNHAREFAPKLRDITPTRLGRFLSDHGCIKLHRGTGNAWRFPELNKARESWATSYAGWTWHDTVGAWQVRN